MTDDDKTLVKRLRAGCLPMKHDAADRIEAQAAEIERLREALSACNRLLTQAWDDKRKIEDGWAELARAALAGKVEQC